MILKTEIKKFPTTYSIFCLNRIPPTFPNATRNRRAVEKQSIVQGIVALSPMVVG
jgi:hypothetical protein